MSTAEYLIRVLVGFLIGIINFYAGFYLGKVLTKRELIISWLRETGGCPMCDLRGRYCYYTYRAAMFLQYIPFGLGRYVIAFISGFWFSRILKEGEAYSARATKT